MRPRLCLLIDAGVGKSTAVQQTQYLRNVGLSGHLTLGFRFTELPDEAEQFLDGGEPWLALRFRDHPQTRDLPLSDALRLIRQKIRRKQLTLLVDALDQVRDGKAAQAKARALAGFLFRYANARCVVSGRPNSIQRSWEDLFSPSGPWEFVQVDVFDEKQQGNFLGDKRHALLSRLEAEVTAIPRMLEAVRNIDEARLPSIRTAADVYWKSLDHTLRQAYREQNTAEVILRDKAEVLFSLLAFELTINGNFDGVSPDDFQRFAAKTLQRRFRIITGRDRFEPQDTRFFSDQLQALGRLNEVIEFAETEGCGVTQIYFRDRTLQDFFAALWITRYSDGEDHQWLRTHQFVRADNSTHDWHDLWRFATEMPERAWAGSYRKPGEVYAQAMAQLYFPWSEPEQTIRSTEMIYRSWPTMLRLAGFFSPTPNRQWNERDLGDPTRVAQANAWQRVEAAAVQEPIANPKNVAGAAVLKFLSEYPAILSDCHGLNATGTASDFETWFVPVPDDPELSLHFQMNLAYWDDSNCEYRKQGETCDSSISQEFLLAKYQVTNAVYQLFDPRHFQRHDDYLMYTLKHPVLMNEPHPRCPVQSVDWYDSWCVATWLGGRLPTEHEWEYACWTSSRGLRTQWCFGDDEKELSPHAPFEGNLGPPDHRRKFVSGPETRRRLANALGLYDMHCNVWEWTASWFHENPEQEREETCIGRSRVLRRGSFFFNTTVSGAVFRVFRLPANLSRSNGIRVSRARKP